MFVHYFSNEKVAVFKTKFIFIAVLSTILAEILFCMKTRYLAEL